MVSAEAIRRREDEARGALSLGDRPVNVGDGERIASTVGGGILLAAGLIRGGLSGLITAGIGGALLWRGSTGHCSLYHALGADTSHGHERGVPPQAGVRVEESVTINRPAEELYRYWRDYSNLPRFMAQVESVTDQGNNVSHWVQRGPLGVTLEWDSEIHQDEPGRLIAWRSLPGGSMDTAGSVHFDAAAGGRGTVVRVNQKFNPPAGKLGITLAELMGQGPETITRETLRRLKQLMETGEMATTEGQPSGRA